MFSLLVEAHPLLSMTALFFGSARMVVQITAGADAQTTEPMLQLFVNEVQDSNQCVVVCFFS